MDIATDPYARRQSRWAIGWDDPVEITDCDLRYLSALWRHGPLPSDILHALARPHAGQAKTTRRLAKLKRRPNCLIAQPDQQRQSYAANHRPLTYERNAKTLAVLQEHGCITDEDGAWVREGRHGQGRQFAHRRMIAVVSALVELGLREHPRIRFIPWKEILDRAPAETRRADDPFRIPVTVAHEVGGATRAVATAVAPDTLFGLEYTLPDGGRVARFVAVECDRTVEFTRPDLRQSSHLRKFLGYREVVRQRLHQTRLGLPNLVVLTVTTGERRLRRSMQVLEEHLPATAWGMFLFKAVPEFLHGTPRPSADLFAGPWLRVGHPPFDLTDPGRQ